MSKARNLATFGSTKSGHISGDSATFTDTVTASGFVGSGASLTGVHDSVAVQAQIDSAAVTLTGAQTIAGEKTFSDNPVVENAAPSITLKDNDNASAIGSSNLIKFVNSTGTVSAQIGNNPTQDAGQNFSIGTNVGYGLNLYTNDSSRMVINGAGDVGIGTTSPEALLDVEGGNQIFRATSNGYATFWPYYNTDPFDGATYDRFEIRFDTTNPIVYISSAAHSVAASRRIALQHAGITKLSVDADGVKFNGETAAANALDDYEEGTWTPAISSGATVNSYTTQNAVYVKIGRLVHIRFLLEGDITATGGVLYLSGLPFNYPSGTLGYSWLACGQFGGNLVSSTDGLAIQATNNLIRSTNLRTSVNSSTTATIEGVGSYYTDA